MCYHSTTQNCRKSKKISDNNETKFAIKSPVEQGSRFSSKLRTFMDQHNIAAMPKRIHFFFPVLCIELGPYVGTGNVLLVCSRPGISSNNVIWKCNDFTWTFDPNIVPERNVFVLFSTLNWNNTKLISIMHNLNL